MEDGRGEGIRGGGERYCWKMMQVCFCGFRFGYFFFIFLGEGIGRCVVYPWAASERGDVYDYEGCGLRRWDWMG